MNKKLNIDGGNKRSLCNPFTSASCSTEPPFLTIKARSIHLGRAYFVGGWSV